MQNHYNRLRLPEEWVVKGTTQLMDSSEAQHESGTETLRCFACRRLWPRDVMRWGTRPDGPVWYPRTVRILRCPDCLPA